MKTVVITGSTRGIGLGLAIEFLKRGHQVVISGRDQAVVDQAVAGLSQDFPADLLLGAACDVTDANQVQALWDAGKTHFGRIDIWINNAGMAHALIDTWDLPVKLIQQEIEVNITGTLYGIKVAVTGMLAQGHGAVYLMEGHGSTGRVQKGLTLYGTTKRAIAYLVKSLAAELDGTPLIAGSLSPGMVVTDLLTIQREYDPETWERNKKIFNILAEKVETVTPILVDGILANDKNGERIAYASRWMLMRLDFASLGLRITDLLGSRFGSGREQGERILAAEAADRLGVSGFRGWSSAERLAWRRWAPLVALLDNLDRWPAADRKDLVKLIRAKGGRQEVEYLRLFNGHGRLREALVALSNS